MPAEIQSHSLTRGSAHGLMAFGLKVARPVSAEHAIKLSRRCVAAANCKLAAGAAQPRAQQFGLKLICTRAAIFHWHLRPPLLQATLVHSAHGLRLIHVKKHTPHQSLPCDLLRTRFAESTHTHSHRQTSAAYTSDAGNFFIAGIPSE